jgi:hypothetical protein
VEGPGAPLLRNNREGLERGARSLPTKAEEGPKGQAAFVSEKPPRSIYLFVSGELPKDGELFGLPGRFPGVSEFRPP